MFVCVGVCVPQACMPVNGCLHLLQRTNGSGGIEEAFIGFFEPETDHITCIIQGTLDDK